MQIRNKHAHGKGSIGKDWIFLPVPNLPALIPSILIKFSVSYRNHTAFPGLIRDEVRQEE